MPRPATIIGLSIAAFGSYSWAKAIHMRKSYQPVPFCSGPNLGFVDERRGENYVLQETSLRNTKTTTFAVPFSCLGLQRTPIQVLAIGDSLALGIGCEQSHYKRDGNPLARTFAERINQNFSLPVAWQTIAHNGATISEIQSFVIPQIPTAFSPSLNVEKEGSTRDREEKREGRGGKEREETGEREEGEREVKEGDTIILYFSGLNDVKNVMFLDVGVFEYFEKFIETVKSIINLMETVKSKENKVYLIIPSLLTKYSAAMRTFPINILADVGVHLWESQKRQALEKLQKECHIPSNIEIIYVDEISPPSGYESYMEDITQLQAVDRVHPNALGYTALGHSYADFFLYTSKRNSL